MPTAAAVWVDVLPNMSKFGQAMRTGVVGGSTAAGTQAGRSFGDAFNRDASKTLKGSTARVSRDLAGSGEKAGRAYGSKFAGAAGGAMKNLAVTAGAAFAGVQVGQFFKDAVSGASDLAETTSKIQQIFGDAAGDVQNFASNASNALGQTRQQALDANATFGIFGKSAGLAGKDLTGFTTELTTLATDLASFNNTSPEQAINAIGSALRGEAEPMRAYGVLLDDASMRQQALKMGLIATTKEALTPQQKVLSAQALIMAQTTTAQGDFARTSGGLANQQRILAARFGDLKTTIGNALLPVATQFFTFLAGPGLGAIRELGDFIRRNATVLKTLGAILLAGVGLWATYTAAVAVHTAVTKGVMVVTKAWTALTKAQTVAQAALNVVMRLNPVALVVTALVALGVALVVAYKRSETFRRIVDGAWAGIKRAVQTAWDGYIKPALNAVGAALKVAGSVVMWLWRNIFAPAFSAIGTIISVLWNSFARPILGMIGAALRKVGEVVGWLWRNAVAPAFRGIGSVISTVWERGIRPVFDRLKTAVGSIGEAFGRARDAVGRAWEGLKEKARGPVQWVIDVVYNNGIRKVWNKVIDAFGGTPLGELNFGGPAPSVPAGSNFGDRFTHYAKGGLARPGWAIVGEEGPELVNFSNPGRVYTADETARAFGAMGGAMDWVRDVAGRARRGASIAGNWVEDRARDLGELSLGGLRTAAEFLLRPVRRTIDAYGGTGFANLIKRVPNKAIDRMLAFLADKDATVPGGYGSAPGVGRNGWAFPLAGGTYSVGAGFPRYPSGRYHSGWDFPAATGTAVYAPIPGMLTNMDKGNRSFGKYVQITAGDMKFIGAHLSAHARGNGMVNAGDLIGRVGSTGNSTGPHLHAEIRQAGRGAINPREVLRFDSGGQLPPGLNLTYNGTSSPEAILTRQQWATMRDAVGGAPPQVQVFIDGREIESAVVRVVDGRDAAMTNSLAYGGI